MKTVKTCEQFKNAITSFQPKVLLGTYNVEKFIEDTYKKYPEVLCYFCGYKTLPALIPGAYLLVNYRNQEIQTKNITVVNDKEELIEALHDALSHYRLKCAIIVPASTSPERTLSLFFNEYSGYYSNLVNYTYYLGETFEKNKIALTFDFNYRIGSVMLGIMERAVDDEVEKLIKTLFCAGMTDGEKAYVAHNYLAKSIEYYNRNDASSLDRSYMQSAYGALIKKKCVCQGYAEAYKRILNAVGIECAVICGKIIGSEEYHAWNVVIINGNRYHVDVTWDSIGAGMKSNEYFLKSDEYFIATRLWQRTPKYICPPAKNPLPEIRAKIMLNTKKYISLGVDRKYLG